MVPSEPDKIRFWNNPKVRAIIIQLMVLAALIGFFAFIINNTSENMKNRGIASGFGFLEQTAGFSISQTLIDYEEADSYGRAFWVGLLNTILISVIGIFLATIIGFFIGIARLSSNWLISKLATAYIEILRNIPLLLQILFWYIAVLRALPRAKQSYSLFDILYLNVRGLYIPKPLFEVGFGNVFYAFIVVLVLVVLLVRWARKRQEQTGAQFPVFWSSLGLLILLPLGTAAMNGFPMSWEYAVLKGFNFKGGLRVMPEFVSMLFALSLYTAAFIGEIVRAGIMAVSKGQTEASYALGLHPGQTLRLIVIPQALRVIVPPLTSQYLNLTKNSSLAVAIAYPDLVHVFAGTALMQTGQAVEILGITMACYLSLSLLISMIMNWYNMSIALKEK
ncbi:MAG: amino acid ABC transporter permease [SAR324 cluster bacterium]|jgi:general L-amino acid transport system permease protein|nr:amino acid ABC transporter permease [Deltaproteobacteria bacterium]MDP6248703.1 amino acid ABC transporter permease [SAR324 cluster bacterium]MBI12214.1 amino acid ABC transporter permease [Deltaproteobacteria bacterium]MBP45004.1 amino acid ABC transporter permease [Deltaproteobacteria bacterium]MDP6465076.1 amino acid ABC transporter permease [SAR324 cluster bacterium]|tara:strand:+ start:215 stop:1390 length:1176 start_codon:yes stop_codon:yes gene_type:complete